MIRLRHWRTAIVAIIAAAVAATALPSSALALSPPLCSIHDRNNHGPCSVNNEPRTAGLNHVGWTYLNLNHCPAGRVCAAVYRSHTAAWRWTNAGWRQASLPGGWVYVYPYSGQWRWAWTQQTGWLAVQGGRFELRSW